MCCSWIDPNFVIAVLKMINAYLENKMDDRKKITQIYNFDKVSISLTIAIVGDRLREFV